MPTEKQRLDLLLVARGLCPSREKAQRAIMAGEVMVVDRVIDKPGTRVAVDAPIEVRAAERYVGRGGLKLEAALARVRHAIDRARPASISAPRTGGFTDCLLQHGAAKVYAIDVGHSQLDWKIRSDPRVVVRENAQCPPSHAAPIFREPIDLCVIDVSFISLTLILPPAARADARWRRDRAL